MSWQLRATSPDLARRYTDEGLWTDLTISELLSTTATRSGDLEVRIWSPTHPHRTNLSALHADAQRLAGYLARRGVGPGDAVSYQMPNHVEAIVTLWAIALTGAVAVPIVHFYGRKELAFILEAAEVRAHCTVAQWGRLDYVASLDALAPKLAALETVVVSETESALPAGFTSFAEAVGADPIDATPSVDPDEPAVVAFTSGTTADPKGVIHSHRSLLAEVAQLSSLSDTDARPILVGAPLAHAIGMLGGLLIPLWRGIAVHVADGWDPQLVLAAMIEGDLSAGSGATYFFTSLLDHPDFGPEHVERMGAVGLGGAPVPAAVGDRARALGIVSFRSYGSTELPSITGSKASDPHEQRCYTDGVAMPGVEVRLLDADGAEVGVGEPGEIVARGPELFVGYTDATLTADAVDRDGWYHTGDVGVLDEQGALTITDRLSDVIIRGGTNVSAAEVEELLMRIDGVAEVAVVAAPDARLGEHACAFVRSHPNASTPTLDDVRDTLAGAGLARQKWPEEVRPIEDFPRTPSGKIRKFELRARLRAELDAATETGS